MEFQYKGSRKNHFYLYLIVFVSALAAVPSHASEAEAKHLAQLNNQFHGISSEFYRYTASKSNLCPASYSNIRSLELAIRSLMHSQQHRVAICSIKKNLAIINKSIENQASIYFLSILLDNNEIDTARLIFSAITDYADNLLVAQAKFLFARYHFRNNDWQQTLTLLDGISDELPLEEASYALLISGIAMQKMKQHRKAIKIYEKIPAESKHYASAIMNIATANIRQDWWTDAHIVINQLLKNNNVQKSDETVNRFYLLLGYSLLEKGYFRNARDAFRKISLDSKYKNRALHGIALSATNQEDFVGALNALAILKSTKPRDLSVEETYLLLPYVYEKLNQNMTASASYTEAMKYYESRINEISSLMNEQAQSRVIRELSMHNRKLVINETEFDLPQQYPISLTINYSELKYFADNLDIIKSKPLKNKIIKLEKAYTKSLTQISNQVFEKRKELLSSYLNQSRYGLARLYDNSGFKAE